MTRRARSLAVTAILACGALGIVSSTQTWLSATLTEGSGEELPVPGASAVPVLAPLSLAALALGAALGIVGLTLRYVFGALAVAIGASLAWATAAVAVTRPTSAVAGAVTDATGITGSDAVAALVAGVASTPWPAATLVGWAVLLAAGVFTLVTARSWRRSGRRFRPEAAPAAPAEDAAPLDAIDSWDDLSRGDDPTR